MINCLPDNRSLALIFSYYVIILLCYYILLHVGVVSNNNQNTVSKPHTPSSKTKITNKNDVVLMNSDILFSSTINDYLGMDHSGNCLNSLAANFYDASFDLLKEITHAMDDNNHTMWHSHLHTLKGMAGIAGAKNLHDLCDRLRTRNRNGFTETPKHIITELHDAIDDYQNAVHQTLHSTFKNSIESCR